MLASRVFYGSAFPEDVFFDVVVSGGGIVGSAMMASLQQLRGRVDCLNGVDKSASMLDSLSNPLGRLMLVDAGCRPVYDASDLFHALRTVSITPVCSRILDSLGVWERLTTKHSYYRMAVRHERVNASGVAEQVARSFFTNCVFGSGANAQPTLEFIDLQKPLGFMCLNNELNACLVDVVVEQSLNIGDQGRQYSDTLRFQTTLEECVLPFGEAADGMWGQAKFSTDDGMRKSKFALLLGCEGRGSTLRRVLGAPSIQHDYAQMGYVCSVRMNKVVDGNVCAFQNFFCDGSIIALLPTSEDTANIVFSTTHAHAKQLMACSQVQLVSELNRRLHNFAPNDIPAILEVPEGPVKGVHSRVQGIFPLVLNVTTYPYAPRAILLGDAAHGIHPFAGQGLNLGMYDVCALTHVLEDAIKAGQDIGNPMTVGQAFAGEMLAHTAPMIAGMEMIKTLTHCAPELSCVGMKALDSFPFVSTLIKDRILQVSSGAAFSKRHKDFFLLA